MADASSHPIPTLHMMNRASFLAWFDAICFVQDLSWETDQAIRHFDGACLGRNNLRLTDNRYPTM